MISKWKRQIFKEKLYINIKSLVWLYDEAFKEIKKVIKHKEK